MFMVWEIINTLDIVIFWLISHPRYACTHMLLCIISCVHEYKTFTSAFFYDEFQLLYSLFFLSFISKWYHMEWCGKHFPNFKFLLQSLFFICLHLSMINDDKILNSAVILSHVLDVNFKGQTWVKSYFLWFF